MHEASSRRSASATASREPQRQVWTYDRVLPPPASHGAARKSSRSTSRAGACSRSRQRAAWPASYAVRSSGSCFPVRVNRPIVWAAATWPGRTLRSSHAAWQRRKRPASPPGRSGWVSNACTSRHKLPSQHREQVAYTLHARAPSRIPRTTRWCAARMSALLALEVKPSRAYGDSESRQAAAIYGNGRHHACSGTSLGHPIHASNRGRRRAALPGGENCTARRKRLTSTPSQGLLTMASTMSLSMNAKAPVAVPARSSKGRAAPVRKVRAPWPAPCVPRPLCQLRQLLQLRGVRPHVRCRAVACAQSGKITC